MSNYDREESEVKCRSKIYIYLNITLMLCNMC